MEYQHALVSRHVYLDSQSTTPVSPEVFEAMTPFFTEAFGTPSALHQHGLRARDALVKAREQVAKFINAESPDDIIFTSDGTESTNLAIKGVAQANHRRGNHFVVSAIEHPSVLNSIEALEKQGFVCTKVPVNSEGLVKPEAVRAAITEKTILVSVHHVNHDIGTIEPIKQISAITSEKGIPLYVDAEASAGWLPIDVRDLGASLLSFSPHKFYGPKGIGVLYKHRSARLAPTIHGGIQENGRRAGVENIPAIVGAGLACEIAAREMQNRLSLTSRLQQRLWDGLKKEIPHLKLNGPQPGPERISTNLNISPEFVEGEGALLLCDMAGIAMASGTACVSKSLKISQVLAAIGLDASLAQAAIILSLGKDNTDDEIDYAVQTIAKVVKKLRGMSVTWDEFQKGKINSAIKA
jgi:cysteine desulfurase